jgi:hypothetical protein
MNREAGGETGSDDRAQLVRGVEKGICVNGTVGLFRRSRLRPSIPTTFDILDKGTGDICAGRCDVE